MLKRVKQRPELLQNSPTPTLLSPTSSFQGRCLFCSFLGWRKKCPQITSMPSVLMPAWKNCWLRRCSFPAFAIRPLHLVYGLQYTTVAGTQPLLTCSEAHLCLPPECNVSVFLDNAVCDRVHITMGTWFNKHGQGRYIAFKAHWVNLLPTGKDAGAHC